MSEKKNTTPEVDSFWERLNAFVESETPERQAERKRISARYGHIKRRLKEGQPLEGELLELAVEAVGGNGALADKLRTGRQLDGYDMHLMVDVYLLHARLKG